MADAKSDDFSALRAYVFDYVAGIVWIVAALVAWFATTTPSLDAVLVRAASSLALNKLPENGQTVLLAILGISIPYCVAIILRPLALRIMSTAQRRQRDLERWMKGLRRQGKLVSVSLDEQAARVVKATLQLDAGLNVTREMRVTYVHARQERLASMVIRWQEELLFKVSVVLPSACLIASLVATAYGFNSASCIASFLFVFVIGSWFVNREWGHFMDCVNTAVLLSSKYPMGADTPASRHRPLRPTSR